MFASKFKGPTASVPYKIRTFSRNIEFGLACRSSRISVIVSEPRPNHISMMIMNRVLVYVTLGYKHELLSPEDHA